MDETQGVPRWDGVERRKQPTPPAPQTEPPGPARWSPRQLAEAVLARAGGNLLSSGVQLLAAYLLTRWH